MKIKYVHCSSSETEKVCDSVVLNERDAQFRRSFFTDVTDNVLPQEEYDKRLLEKMEADKQKGLVLFYQVVSG